MSDKTISILGCGWLGLPLAQHLVGQGYIVNGSTTSADKCAVLKNSKVAPFLLTAGDTLAGENVSDFFQSKVLVLNIPFRRQFEDPNEYKKQIDAVVSHIEDSPIEFVIFTSSTSVYPESQRRAHEDDPLMPDTPRSVTLRKVEQALMENKQFQTTIVRFAGMYGGSRRIGQILAGRTNLSDGDSPVNLIHLDDCVAIVHRIIEQDVRNEIFNACSDNHPLRKDIYTKAALHYNLEPPQFNDHPSTRVKIVSNDKIKKMLDYSFIHPDPLQF